jgi:hypothetical protein
MDVFDRVADRREVDGQLGESLRERRELRGDLVGVRPCVEVGRAFVDEDRLLDILVIKSVSRLPSNWMTGHLRWGRRDVEPREDVLAMLRAPSLVQIFLVHNPRAARV